MPEWTFYVRFPCRLPCFWPLMGLEASPFQGSEEFLVKSVLASWGLCTGSALWSSDGSWDGPGESHGLMASRRSAMQRPEVVGVRAEAAIRTTGSTGVSAHCSWCPQTEGGGGQFCLWDSNSGWFIRAPGLFQRSLTKPWQLRIVTS